MGQATFYYRSNKAPKPNRPNLIGSTILIEYDNKLLLEHRADSERWAIIGGSLKINESLIECAIRETFEETSIKLDADMLSLYKIYDDPSIIISYTDGNVFRSIMAVFKVYLKDEPKLICSFESTNLRFFDREELKNVKIVETHIPILHDYLTK